MGSEFIKVMDRRKFRILIIFLLIGLIYQYFYTSSKLIIPNDLGIKSLEEAVRNNYKQGENYFIKGPLFKLIILFFSIPLILFYRSLPEKREASVIHNPILLQNKYDLHVYLLNLIIYTVMFFIFYGLCHLLRDLLFFICLFIGWICLSEYMTTKHFTRAYNKSIRLLSSFMAICYLLLLFALMSHHGDGMSISGKFMKVKEHLAVFKKKIGQWNQNEKIPLTALEMLEGKYIVNIPKDPWDNSYQLSENKDYIYSLGKNGERDFFPEKSPVRGDDIVLFLKENLE